MADSIVLMCSYWENRLVPSVKQTCEKCRRAVAVSHQTRNVFANRGKRFEPWCIPCALKERPNEIVGYMPGTAPPGAEVGARLLAGLPISVAARLIE